MLNIFLAAPLVLHFLCQSQGEQGDPCTMKLMNYQLSMNVNYWAHMCIHHPHTLICQKIRPHAAGRVHVSDVCAKLLSVTRAINYPNNIKICRIDVQTVKSQR